MNFSGNLLVRPVAPHCLGIYKYLREAVLVPPWNGRRNNTGASFVPTKENKTKKAAAKLEKCANLARYS
jgi:hypothetical protein